MAALYTENGQVLPPNSEAMSGRQAIQSFWQSAIQMGIKAVKLETLEVESHGATANEVGRFILHGEGGQVIDAGKYVVIWRQEAGQWKLHRDIWNSNRPAPGQPTN
jgi:ketosteroid isomerase-like protein